MDHPVGVVPGRAHQGEPAFDLALHERHGEGFGAPGTDKMRFGHHRPWVGDAEVDTFDVTDIHKVGLEFHDSVDVEEPFFENLILGVEQTLFPLRVGRADGPVESREKHQAGFVFRLQHNASPFRGCRGPCTRFVEKNRLLSQR